MFQSAGSLERRRSDFSPLVLFALPWLLLLANNNWIFTPVGVVDPWIYFGYFQNLPLYLNLPGLREHYFANRLSWILPGYTAYQSFPPLVANYVLHLGVYYLVVFSLYFTLRMIFDSKTALITATTMGCYAWLLRAVGWDYVDGAAIAYLSLLLLLLTCAAYRRYWKLAMAGAGAAYMALLTTNLFLLIFTPALLGYYIFFNHTHRKNNLLLSALFFGAGICILAVLLGLYYSNATGDYFFLRNSFNASASLLQNQANKTAVAEAYPGPFPWLGFPVVAAVIGAVDLLRRLIQRPALANRFAVFLEAQYVFIFLVMYAFNLAGGPVLRVNFYVSFLIPMMILAIGALLVDKVKLLKARQYVIVFSAGLLCLVFPFFAPSPFNIFASLPGELGILFVVTLGAIALLILEMPRVIPQALLALFLVLSVGNFLVERELFNLGRSSSSQDNFLAVVDSVKAVQAVNPEGNVRFWFGNGDLKPLAVAVASAYTYSWGRVVDEYPQSPLVTLPLAGKLCGTSDTILIISQETGVFTRIKNLLEDTLSCDSSLLAEQTIQHGDTKLELTFITTGASRQTRLQSGRFEFNTSIAGSGWYGPELWPGQKTYQWTGPDTESTMILAKLPDSPAELKFCALSLPNTDTLQTLEVFVNNERVPLNSTAASCGIEYHGTIPEAAIEGDEHKTLLTFRVARTYLAGEILHNADTRKLGVLFDWLTIDN